MKKRRGEEDRSLWRERAEPSHEIQRRLQRQYGLSDLDSELIEAAREERKKQKSLPSLVKLVAPLIVIVVFAGLGIWLFVRGLVGPALLVLVVAGLALFFHLNKQPDRSD